VLSYYLLPAVWRYATPRKLVSQADVFTSAFGSRALGAVVSVVAVAAMIPYLALQLKGLGIIVSATSHGSISSTAALWIGAFALSIYVAASGIRHVAAHDGRGEHADAGRDARAAEPPLRARRGGGMARIAVDEAVLEDLRRRLDAVRWPDEPPDAGRESYDWRAAEAVLNGFESGVVEGVHHLADGDGRRWCCCTAGRRVCGSSRG
jgi:hypothetical protein